MRPGRVRPGRDVRTNWSISHALFASMRPGRVRPGRADYTTDVIRGAWDASMRPGRVRPGRGRAGRIAAKAIRVLQ